MTLFTISLPGTTSGIRREAHLSAVLIDRSSCEFPASHPYRHGLQCRYNYLMGSDEEGRPLPFTDIIKCDLLDPSRRQVYHSPGFVGEPVFVPRVPGCSPEAMSLDEDDGYVITQLLDPVTSLSSFVVLDAKHVDQGPICVVKLLHYLPSGFHGTFTPSVFQHLHRHFSKL